MKELVSNRLQNMQNKLLVAQYGALSLSLSLFNGAIAQDSPRPPLRDSSILPDLGRLLSSFYILASLHLPPLHQHEALLQHKIGETERQRKTMKNLSE
jgi:hypothetical protein